MCVCGGGLSPAIQSWEEGSKSKLANDQSPVEGVPVPYDTAGNQAPGSEGQRMDTEAVNCLSVGLTKPCTWLA